MGNFDKLLPKINKYKKKIHANFHKASEAYRTAKAKQLDNWFYNMMKKYGLKSHKPGTPVKGKKKGSLKLKGKGKKAKKDKKKAKKSYEERKESYQKSKESSQEV